MKSKSKFEFTRLALIMILAALLSACAATGNTQSSAVEETASAPAPEPVEPWDGDGMDIPMDGSSLEAWDKSMARVKAHTDPSSYTTLVNALGYLLLYDLSAKKDRETLVSHLDGLTGNEIVDKVAWQRR